MKKLIGYRTYIIAIVIAVLNLLVAMGYINTEYVTQINLILGALGLGTLRASVGRN